MNSHNLKTVNKGRKIMTNQTNIEVTGTTIQDFFDKKEIEEVARRTKFVQRVSRLNGFNFLKVIIFGFINDPKANLDDLAQVCEEVGVEISVQGFDQRLTPYAVEFMKEMLNLLIYNYNINIEDKNINVDFNNVQQFPRALTGLLKLRIERPMSIHKI